MMDSSYLAGMALVITAAVGLFQLKVNRKSEVNKTNIDGANTAINGLGLLAEQHAAEIKRLENKHDDYVALCEQDKVELMRLLAVHEGQIDVLKLAATGITGPKGAQGLRGSPGKTGEKGEPGKTGKRSDE